jgi:hypothetical protein
MIASGSRGRSRETCRKAQGQIPPDWLKFKQNSTLGDATIFRHLLADNTQISFYSCRKPTDTASGEVFKSHVDSDAPTPKLLYGKSLNASKEANISVIKQLSDALGRSLVGNNQLTATNDRTPPFTWKVQESKPSTEKMSSL